MKKVTVLLPDSTTAVFVSAIWYDDGDEYHGMWNDFGQNINEEITVVDFVDNDDANWINMEDIDA